jgi:hypothetical protein
MIFDEFKDYPDTTTPLNASFLNGLLNLLMPIGKTEIFYDNEDHSNYMGFTWERTSIGKVPVGINTADTDFNTIGKTGGEKKHTLTVSEMPSHSHNVYLSGGSIASGTGRLNWQANTAQKFGGAVEATGGGQSHNNLQPYEVMAFWKRVA